MFRDFLLFSVQHTILISPRQFHLRTQLRLTHFTHIHKSYSCADAQVRLKLCCAYDYRNTRSPVESQNLSNKTYMYTGRNHNRAASWENLLFAYANTKAQISCAITAQLISAFVFATQTVQSIYFLNPKFQVSNHPLWLYTPVCFGPGRKPRIQVLSRRGSY